MTIFEKVQVIISVLPINQQLKLLEKLSMKIRKQNNIRINTEVNVFLKKIPKIK
jgi:hypothetical protein